ncbi:MAG TPA: peptide transporter [Acetobacteraceae bacterium]|jgi:tetratricopeptide (TPR) repeat protein|nr:peptide transporter [Acetobacteraceae bacterium]
MASPELLSTADQFLKAGSYFQAEPAARAAMADDPTDPRAVLLLGLSIAAMGEAERAAPVLLRAGAMAPDTDHPCTAFARFNPPFPPAAVNRVFQACLRLAPSDNRLKAAFADSLIDAGQPLEALGVLADLPDSASVHHMRGLAQADLSRFPAAITDFEHVLALRPDAAASWSNLGMVLKIEGRLAESIAAHGRAVALDPDNNQFRVNRSVALLKAGQWESAWLDYERRFSLPGAPVSDLTKLLPSLRPHDSLAGRTVVALHEDGFGDTLQFLRYLPLLAERGARVVACVPSPLVRIMRAVPGVAEVVTGVRLLPRHDFICPMFSLPRVFGTTLETIPPVPPLDLDPAALHQWKKWLPAKGLKAGLVWAGQARPSLPGFATLDRRRSAGLAAFAPLLAMRGISFVSLQAGPAADQRLSAPIPLIDPMPHVDDFADTAAVVANLDVVVSVDTSVVHLAGLLRKPVFLLDRYDGCWRWLSDRTDTPWYPDLTIFRQDTPGDWSAPMEAAAEALRAMAVERGVVIRPAEAWERAFIA